MASPSCDEIVQWRQFAEHASKGHATSRVPGRPLVQMVSSRHRQLLTERQRRHHLNLLSYDLAGHATAAAVEIQKRGN